jgi:hypothetical protein
MRGDLDRCNMTVTARSGTIHLTCDRSDGHDAEAFNGGFEDLAHYDLYQDASWMLLGGELVVAYRTDDTFDESLCPPLIPDRPLAGLDRARPAPAPHCCLDRECGMVSARDKTPCCDCFGPDKPLFAPCRRPEATG